MTPEEFNSLKERVDNLSTMFVALSTHKITEIEQNSKLEAVLTTTLAMFKSDISVSDFGRVFKAAYQIHQDRNLIILEDSDPALGALIDNRPIDDIPTSS